MKGFLIPAAALAALMPAGASAQDLSTKETRAVTHGYAQCVVKRQGKLASRAILTNADNAAILEDYPKLIIGDCLTHQMRTGAKMTFSGELYRYALADALVARELAGQPAPDVSAVPALPQGQAGTPPAPLGSDASKSARKDHEDAVRGYEQSVAYAFLGGYGECIVRRDPSAAKALLMTKPDTSEEATAFGGLQDSLAHCLDQGHTLTFGRTALRGTIAINYYRLAHAAAGRTAG